MLHICSNISCVSAKKMDGEKCKKKFDKKAYRTKKYDNKAKLDDWKEKRRVAMQHKYKKLLKKEKNVGSSAAELYRQFEAEDTKTADLASSVLQQSPARTKNSANSGKYVKNKSLNRAKLRFEEKRAAAARKQEEFLQRQKDRAEALKKYKQKKDLRFKKLSAKNKKGQPLMGGRIELLLEKIQEQMSNS